MDNRILMVCLGLLILVVVLIVAFSRDGDNRMGYVGKGGNGGGGKGRNGYAGNSLEKAADKRYIYTPTIKAAVNQPSQLRYGGIIPVDTGLNEYQASAYPVFLLNQQKIGLNPADDQNKIDKFYADYRIGGGRDLDTQLHHDAVAAIKPNYAIYS